MRDEWGTSTTPGYSRRALLRAALGAAGAAALAACGSGGGASPTAGTPPPAGGGANPTATTGAAPRPATRAATSALGAAVTATRAAVEGTIPSGVEGVPDAYLKPPPVYKSTQGTPGKGGKVTIFTILYGAAPAARGDNLFWQELEKRLGVTWEPNFAPNANYGEKAAAVIAGGDLGDLFYINYGLTGTANQLRTIQQGAFTDLTPYLRGDGAREFPNLSQYPPYNQEYIWRNASVKGKTYGPPKPVLRSSNVPFYRGDWAAKIGAGPPKNAADTAGLLTGFSKRDPDGNGQADTYGMSQAGGGWNVGFFAPMYRAPNGWRLNQDGTLTNAIETEEYKRAVEFTRRLYAEGAYHPDAAGMTSPQVQDAYRGGKIGMHSEGFVAFWGTRGSLSRIRELPQSPNGTIEAFIPPGPDGGQGVTHNLSGFFGFTAIPAPVGRNRERVRELLQIMNYLAAPFGSEEQVFLGNGIEGVHHELRPDGTRINNDRAAAELGGLVYMLASEYRFYYPGAAGHAERAQQLSKEILALGIENPTLGLSSDTNNTKAAELGQLINDRISEIVTGRAPFSTYDTMVAEWKSRGGDQVRREYEQDRKAQ
jgi:putative aldouronate transport system substrate-binding protein